MGICGTVVLSLTVELKEPSRDFTERSTVITEVAESSIPDRKDGRGSSCPDPFLGSAFNLNFRDRMHQIQDCHAAVMHVKSGGGMLSTEFE